MPFIVSFSRSILHMATRLIFLSHSTELSTLQLNAILWLVSHYSPLCIIHSDKINIQILNCPTFGPLFMLSLLLSPYVQILPHPERLNSNSACALRTSWTPIFIIRPLCALFVCFFFLREKHISIHS